MKQNNFNASIWPEPKNRRGNFFNLNNSITKIEDVLKERHPSYFPVLVCSARAAITMVLEGLLLSRKDLVRMPAYSSHCLLDAVSRVATPCPYIVNGLSDAAIIFHQWGFLQSNSPLNNNLLIEDACDSLCERDSNLMILDGKFEIWSLPKIIGASGGAVIWCKSENDMINIRLIRDSKSCSGFIQSILRDMGKKSDGLYDYWSGREPNCGIPSLNIVNSISDNIKSIDTIIEKRKSNLDAISDILPLSLMTPNKGRLPVVIPLVNLPDHITKELIESGLSVGFRYYEIIGIDGVSALTKVLPLPIHQNINISFLSEALRIIKKG